MKSEELAFLHLNSDVPTNTFFIMQSWVGVFFGDIFNASKPKLSSLAN